jgi:hypothetical protein
VWPKNWAAMVASYLKYERFMKMMMRFLIEGTLTVRSYRPESGEGRKTG